MKLIAVKTNDGGLKGNIAVVAVGIIASEEIVENEEIIANTLVNGMGTEVIERSAEIALEIGSQSFSNFIDIIQNMFNKDAMNLMKSNENRE